MASSPRLAAVAALALVGLVAANCSSGTGRPAPSASGLTAVGEGLQGLPGLQATVYARALPKASAFAVDGRGRLWVATADYADQGGDGVYVVPAPGAVPAEVITGLHTPLGLLWYHDSLYVTSKAGVDAYGGFDGSRFVERRPVVTLPTGVGESNGIALAPDGRMVMGVSAPCDSCTPTSPWSAAVVSFRPDGGDLRVYARAIRAPVGLAYDPRDNDLFVTMNQRDDLGGRTPGDWLAVVREGQTWGFPACFGQGGSPCSGVPRPVAVLDKHAAVSGVAIVTGQLGPAVGTSALVAEWALGKVQRVALRSGGRQSSPAPVGPFLTGLEKPVPVLLGPDGALFVGDWGSGTVYRISVRR